MHDASQQTSGGLSKRTAVVWSSLALSMTFATAFFLAVERGPAHALGEGRTIAPLAASSQVATTEVVLDPAEPLDLERWQGITVHHSGSSFDTPEKITGRHEAMNLRGLGYHFIIGNGRGMGDGEVHIGYRWRDQLPGAHAAGPEGDWHNQHSIAICLVGDGDRSSFTDAQLRRLHQLIAALSGELGLDAGDVNLHRDIAAVESPGRLFPEAAFRARLASMVNARR